MNLLAKLGLRPVLVDVGASGDPPEIWRGIERESIYVGFDPDLRELRDTAGGRFHRSVMLNELVTSDKSCVEARFYLTRSPLCSSALRPDAPALSNWLFADLFEVEREAHVRATTLDAVLDRLSLARIDWLKLDSQGTDLRLFRSLRDEVRRRTLAVDIEPGLIDAYTGEDLFVDAHRALLAEGFWLSRLDVKGTVRASRATSALLRDRHGVPPALVERNVRPSPGWVEARYFRTIDHIAAGGFGRDDYVLAWTFALLDGQAGFALDLALAYERAFGADEVATALVDEPLRRVRRARGRARLRALAKACVPGQVRRWLKGLAKRGRRT